jgi:hypothetical protein
MKAFTVGHSTHSLDGFAALLVLHGVERARRARVVTRSSIASRSRSSCPSAALTIGSCPHWAGGARHFGSALSRTGLAYVQLGGVPRPR